MTEVSAGPEAGRTIRGYELAARLDEGQFGVIYRAYQPSVGRDVAVKVIRPEWANHPEFIRRFNAEAQLIARLEHPYIVPLYDYWREPDGAYLVMRLVRGGSLKAALERGPRSLDETSRLVEQIGSALATAHRQGVVHRDLKPANILLDEDGNAYLSDFGIAKDLESAETMTGTGGAPGSPAYMAPEQLEGAEITLRTDIYALGMVLYETLSGHHAYETAGLTALIASQLRDPVPSLSDAGASVPAAVDEVIARATAKNPAERYGDVLDLLSDWRRALDPGTTATTPRTRARAVAVASANPYKGLRAFQESDAPDFFGRATLTETLIERMRAPGGRFLAVVGPSGSGKSSVVRAGLLPAIRRGAIPGSDRWFLAGMIPGRHPFEELEAALLRVAVNPPASLLEQLRDRKGGLRRAARRVLPSDDTELVLVIDQFEELFTLAEEEERDAFIESLVAALFDDRSKVRVIVTLRADFYDRPLLYSDLGELVKAQQETVLPLSPQEMERAIAGPAQRVGVDFEPGLMAEIVSEVVDQPGALPLLQYALTELFDGRQGDLLTAEAYREMGGVMGALGRRAEEIYDRLDADGREATRQLFLRLVTLGEGTEDTRRRVLRSEVEGLGGRKTMDEVIEAYGRFRLLSFDNDPATRTPTVEVAHEALLREWGRYRHWIDESRGDLHLHRRLAGLSAEWEDAGRDVGMLLAGTRLAQTEALARSNTVALTAGERAFLDASLERREADEAAEQARLAHGRQLERRAARRRNILLVVMAGAAVVAVGLSVFALAQRRDAQGQAKINQAGFLAAQAELLAEDDPELAVLLAVAAAGATPEITDEAERALRTTLNTWRRVAEIQGRTAAALGADDTFVLTGDENGAVAVQAVRTEVVTLSFPAAHDGAITALAWSEANNVVASADETGVVILWDVDLGSGAATQRHRLTHSERVSALAFSEDAALLATSTDRPDPLVHIWDAASGAPAESAETQIVHGQDRGVEAAFGFGGAAIAVPQKFQHGFAVDLTSGISTDLEGFGGGLGAAWEQNLVAIAGADGFVRVWDADASNRDDGRSFVVVDLRYSLPAHRDQVLAVSIVDRGGELVLATGGRDLTAKLWDATNGAPIAVLGGHQSAVVDVSFSSDGAWLVTVTEEAVVSIWDAGLVGDGEWLKIAGPRPFRGVAVDPAAELLMSADGVVALQHDAATGQSVGELTWEAVNERGESQPVDSAPSRVVWSVDGSIVGVSGSQAGQLFGRDGAQLQQLWACTGFCTGIETEYSRIAIGNQLVRSTVAKESGSMTVFARTGDEFSLGDQEGFVPAVDIGDVTGRILTGDSGGTVWLWPASGDAVRTHLASVAPEGADAANRSVRVNDVRFSPDETLIATASDDHFLRVYSIEEGLTPSLTLVWEVEAHAGAVYTSVFDPTGARIATTGDDRRTVIWDVATGTQIRVLEGHAAAVLDGAWWPDGTRFVTASADRSIKVHALLPEDLLGRAELLIDERFTRDASFTDEECERFFAGVEACPGR